jgi:GT2 family glycosyltransferase
MSEPAGAIVSAPVDVSVIVATFNNEDTIRDCLRAVRGSAQESAVEVLVVDNASTDRTVEWAREVTPDAKIIKLDNNHGFAAANNAALAQASGRYVVLVNSDAFPDAGAVDTLIRRADSNTRIGLVGGRLRYATGRMQPSAGHFPSILRDLGVALFLHRCPFVSRLQLSVLADPYHYRDAHQVDWVSAAFCLARREVGSLPAAAFMYGEDVEWAYQARQRGLETWLEPSATAVHLVGGASRSRRARQLRQVRRVDFELRWFRPKGGAAIVGARVAMSVHAIMRIAVYSALLPVNPRAAREGIAEFTALLVAAVRRPATAMASADRAPTAQRQDTS